MRRYVQQHSFEAPPAGLPVASHDGYAELWFDDLETLLGGLDAEVYKTVIVDDEADFQDRAKTVMMISAEAPIV